MLPVGSAVVAEYFVKPNRRLAEHVRPLPRVPWKIGLRLARYQSPVDRRYVILLCDRQGSIKGRTRASSHVLRANDWPVVRQQLFDALFESLRPVIVVERDDVRLL